MNFKVFLTLFLVIVGSLPLQAGLGKPLHRSLPKKKPQKDPLKDSENCAELITHFEQKHGIPDKLLLAIAMVESRKSPWAVYARGQSKFFKSKEAATAYIHKMRAKGRSNINVGCMQINLGAHKRHFRTFDEALRPYNNIEFAAKLLKTLHKTHGSWEKAVLYYNSSTTYINNPYQQKVYRTWERIKNTPSNRNSSPKMVVGLGAGMKRKS